MLGQMAEGDSTILSSMGGLCILSGKKKEGHHFSEMQEKKKTIDL